MSEIKINNTTYREGDIALNWGVEYAKSMIDAHSSKIPLDHPNGSVTLEKLSPSVTEWVNSAVKEAQSITDNRLVFKVFQIPAGERFVIKPSMFCLVFPYGDRTIGVMKKDNTELIDGNVGFTICMSAEINTGEYANGANHRVFFTYVPQSFLSTLNTYHNLVDVGAYFKNNGNGTMYVYALMREVDVE